ncbi:MAG: hypothetical protein KGL35_12115 [Bradyrhizobium sp.]|nr:hypothetical protein [Bradyrhizobium sp.]
MSAEPWREPAIERIAGTLYEREHPGRFWRYVQGSQRAAYRLDAALAVDALVAEIERFNHKIAECGVKVA